MLPLWGTACPRACFSASGYRGSPRALGDYQRSTPLPALFFPVPACRASGGPVTRSHWLRAPGVGKTVRRAPRARLGDPALATALSPGRCGLRMLRCPYRRVPRALRTPWLKNRAASPSRCRPSRLLPLGGEVGQLCLASSGPSGLLGSEPAEFFSHLQWLLNLARSRGRAAASGGGELAPMAQEAPVALRGGCQALKFLSDHTVTKYRSS